MYIGIIFFQEDFEEALNILQVCQDDYSAAVKPDWCLCYFWTMVCVCACGRGEGMLGWLHACEHVFLNMSVIFLNGIWMCVCVHVCVILFCDISKWDFSSVHVYWNVYEFKSQLKTYFFRQFLEWMLLFFLLWYVQCVIVDECMCVRQCMELSFDKMCAI